MITSHNVYYVKYNFYGPNISSLVELSVSR